MSLLRRVGLLVAGALVSSLLVALPVAPAHADYDLGVTWPDVSQINPTVTDYEITVIDTGPGDLEARWIGNRQPIPHTGTVTLDLPSDDSALRVEIWRCLDGTCEWAGVSSPVLSVHSRLASYLEVAQNSVTSPGTLSAQLWASTFSGITDLSFTWVLRDSSSAEVDRGSGSMELGTHLLTADIPAGLADGSYTLEAAVHGSFAGGTLTVIPATTSVDVDNSAPEFTVTPGFSAFFPHEDGYRDTLPFKINASEAATYSLDLLDETDASLWTWDAVHNLGVSPTVWWDGTMDGTAVPAGTYRFRVTATDIVGHSTSVESTSFRLDLARKRKVSMDIELPAAKVIYDRFVGECSTLAKPSSHRWKASLGLYSQTKCTSQKRNASVVVMWGAWWLPTAMRGLQSFDHVSISAYGGAAVGHRQAYLVSGLIDRKGAFSHRQQFSPKMRWHGVGGARNADQFTSWARYQDGRPYVVWSSGLTDGSRYDIRSFRMLATFDALVEPDGTLVAAPTRAGTTPPRSAGHRMRPVVTEGSR